MIPSTLASQAPSAAIQPRAAEENIQASTSGSMTPIDVDLDRIPNEVLLYLNRFLGDNQVGKFADLCPKTRQLGDIEISRRLGLKLKAYKSGDFGSLFAMALRFSDEAFPAALTQVLNRAKHDSPDAGKALEHAISACEPWTTTAVSELLWKATRMLDKLPAEMRSGLAKKILANAKTLPAGMKRGHLCALAIGLDKLEPKDAADVGVAIWPVADAPTRHLLALSLGPGQKLDIEAAFVRRQFAAGKSREVVQNYEAVRQYARDFLDLSSMRSETLSQALDAASQGEQSIKTKLICSGISSIGGVPVLSRASVMSALLDAARSIRGHDREDLAAAFMKVSEFLPKASREDFARRALGS